jgi:predicted metalloprotease with PDZ domain
MHTTSLLAGALAIAAITTVLPAQERIERREAPRARTFTLVDRDDDRPRIGVATGPSGKRDTLGVLVTDVTPDGPAAKAGIEEGDRLQSVNGVDLRLSSADTEDEFMNGIPTRRLIRELGKLKVGDVADLRVYRDGQLRNVKVTTVAAEDLVRDKVSTATFLSDRENRATLGIGLGGSGSRRDTLGVLVATVIDDGPADQARIEEGDRIAAINGVDLRVSSADAGDWAVTSSRMRRLNRELEKVKPGDEVELRIARSGQTRTVRVKTVAQKDLPRGSSMFFFGGDGPSMIMRDGGFSFSMPRGMVAPGTRDPMMYFDRLDDGTSRMRLSPEARMRLEGQMSEVMSRLRDAQIRIRPRIEFDRGKTWHEDDASNRGKRAPAPARITTASRVAI